jgi:putative Holliday junction resolvase
MARILGIDFGTRRVGAALSDPRGRIASPLEVYERRNPALDAAHYRKVAADEGVERIVIGLPVHTSGREGDLASLAREFGAWLQKETGLAVMFSDERYSSREADDALRLSGLNAKGRKARRDMLAAQILLQAYLDAGSPTEEAPSLPLDDRDDLP